MASVGIRLSDRVYGLSAGQAQLLAGQLQRRLTVPEPIARLADQLWEQSMLDPTRGQTSTDVVLDDEQKRALIETMSRVEAPDDIDGWNRLLEALQREVRDQEPIRVYSDGGMWIESCPVPGDQHYPTQAEAVAAGRRHADDDERPYDGPH